MALDSGRPDSSQADMDEMDFSPFRNGDGDGSLPQEDLAQPVSSRVQEAYDWVEWFVGIVVFVVLFLTFIARTVGVFGISMETTLTEGDSLIVTRLTGAPEYGDIVAIAQPNDQNRPLIKRVIATEGQTVEVNIAGEVRVDGVLLDEPYTLQEHAQPRGDQAYPLVVPDGCFFAMGDNRNNSLDSRYEEIGVIDNRYILGTAVFRFAPLNRLGFIGG